MSNQDRPLSDEMDYYSTWVKLKDFVKASNKGQFEDVLMSIVKEENERSNTQKRLFAESLRSKDPHKCEFGHEVYSHNTVDGWCCACDADQAFMEAEIQERVKEALLNVKNKGETWEEQNEGTVYELNKAIAELTKEGEE